MRRGGRTSQRVVAEVPLDLADHRRHRELQEILAEPGLPATDGLHQAEEGQLFEITTLDARARNSDRPATAPRAGIRSPPACAVAAVRPAHGNWHVRSRRSRTRSARSPVGAAAIVGLDAGRCLGSTAVCDGIPAESKSSGGTGISPKYQVLSWRLFWTRTP